MKHPANEKRGVIKSFNISPKGMFEGVLLKSSGELIQINFPPEAGSAVRQAIGKGDTVTLLVAEEADERPRQHPVFQLLEIKSPKGTRLHLNAELETVHTEGKVKRINFARHGEPNGAILDNGDFIHLKPDGAKAIQLETGMVLSVEGETKPSFIEHRIIEARVVNGVALKPPPAAKKKPAAAKKKHGPKTL